MEVIYGGLREGPREETWHLSFKHKSCSLFIYSRHGDSWLANSAVGGMKQKHQERGWLGVCSLGHPQEEAANGPLVGEALMAKQTGDPFSWFFFSPLGLFCSFSFRIPMTLEFSAALDS